MKPINEYLLSKKNNTVLEEPDQSWSTKEIAEWILQHGVTKCVDFDSTFYIPEENKLMIELGPKHYKNENEYWVALIGNPHGKGAQTVTIKPRSKSMFSGLDKREKIISFELAIELVYKMIENPNKVIKYEADK